MSKPARKVEKPRAEYGSDVIVDMLKAFEFEYIAVNPGATFRGLHDSLVNYGGNRLPELILCPDEEITVELADGYARACVTASNGAPSPAGTRRCRTRSSGRTALRRPIRWDRSIFAGTARCRRKSSTRRFGWRRRAGTRRRGAC